jgi:formylmethanofuran dehydrogenase subunit C
VITLAIRSAVSVPIEAETITPHALTGKRVSEIEALPVVQGNATARLGDFFQVSGDADGAVRLTGDCSRVKYIGKGMTDGRIEVDGDAGMHLGAGASETGPAPRCAAASCASRGMRAIFSARPIAGARRGCVAVRSSWRGRPATRWAAPCVAA